MRRRTQVLVDPAETPGPFVAADWLPRVGAGVDPMMRRVHAHRLWESAWADWGRRNGYDPEAPYEEAEGKRWHQFRHGSAARQEWHRAQTH